MEQPYSYNQCLQYMYGLRRFGIKLELSTVRDILKQLGNPQYKFASIHIAGTNGKGSIASTLSSILHEAGYKVGLYTSPHLIKFNERICINTKPIADENVVSSFKAVKDVHPGEREPTFFEYSTAMALYEFGAQNVDWAVIETGMGGRLDATNMVDPTVTIISNLSIEHKTYLGNTLEEIAGEKGGIIKNDVPLITGVRQKKALQVLKRIASEKQAPLFRLGDSFKVRRNRKDTFTYYGMDNTWKEMRTGLLGNYQVDNTALVLAACEILRQKDVDISLDSIKQGIKKNKWPGRLEVISTAPYIIIDGAHNLVAARNLAAFLSDNLNGRKLTLITGILDDKPYKTMLESLVPLCDTVILTQPKIDRSLPPETLYSIVKSMTQEIKIIPDVGEAVKYGIENASSNDAVCIAGSLYVVGEAKEALDLSLNIN